MAKKTMRVAVVGIGAIAQVAHIPALKRMADVEIAALCDPDEAKTSRVAQRYGVPVIAEQIDDLVSDEMIDAFIICTPNYLHAPMTIAALEAGKHVLCERPMARNAKEAESMVAAARKSNRTLMCALNHRFRSDSLLLKRFVERRELGDVFYAKAGWLRQSTEWSKEEWRRKKRISGGGVLMDLGLPMLDLALWILGNPAVETVTASAHIRKDGEVEDSMSAFLRLAGGSTLALEVGWGLLMEKDFAYCNLFGENGAALWNPLRIHQAMHGSLVNVTPEIPSPRNLYKKSIENEISHFLDALRKGRDPIGEGKELIGVMNVVDAIYRSASSGHEVKVD